MYRNKQYIRPDQRERKCIVDRCRKVDCCLKENGKRKRQKINLQ